MRFCSCCYAAIVVMTLPASSAWTGGFSFIEGTVADKQGDLYFTDIPARRTCSPSSVGEEFRKTELDERL